MPKNLKKVPIYPNIVITLLEVNSLILHSLHYIVLALCKAARPAQIKEKNQNFGAITRLFVSYLFVSYCNQTRVAAINLNLEKEIMYY